MEVWAEANPSHMTESGFRLQPFPAESQFNKSRLLSSYRFLNRFESKSLNDAVPTVAPDILELCGWLSLFLYNAVQSSNVFPVEQDAIQHLKNIRLIQWKHQLTDVRLLIHAPFSTNLPSCLCPWLVPVHNPFKLWTSQEPVYLTAAPDVSGLCFLVQQRPWKTWKNHTVTQASCSKKGNKA